MIAHSDTNPDGTSARAADGDDGTTNLGKWPGPIAVYVAASASVSRGEIGERPHHQASREYMAFLASLSATARLRTARRPDRPATTRRPEPHRTPKIIIRKPRRGLPRKHATKK